MGTIEHRRKPWRMIPLVLLVLLAFLPSTVLAWGDSSWSRDSDSSWSRDSSSGTDTYDSSTSTTAATAGSVTTTATTAPPTNCTECHGSTTLENHHSTSYFLNGECNRCHEGVTVTGDCSQCHSFGLQNTHHLSQPALAGNCAQCHTNPGDYQQCLSCHGGKVRTRHHEVAATGVSCQSCHTALAAGTGCRSCHTSPVDTTHHEAAAAKGISCKTCHSGIVETASGCASCHNFKPASGNTNPHHTAAVDPYKLTCTSCHKMEWDTATSSYKMALPTTSECVTCHTTVVGTASISATHHMTLPAQTRQCGTCHQGVTPVADCATCHNAAGGNVVAIHHATQLYADNACTTCHQGAEATKIACATCHNSTAAANLKPTHHTSADAAAGNCKACHTSIGLQGAGCASCHTQPIREIHHGDPLQSVGGDCGACHQSVSSPTVCANCHSAESPHHSTTWAQQGECTHCHKVPAWAADRPKQAACRECHGTNQHNKGGPIKDFGACAACHNQDTFHAAPGGPVGYTRSAPGKGKFAMFWSQYTRNGDEEVRENVSPNGEDMNDEGGRKWRTPSLSFNKVQISNKGRTYTVPSFDPLNPAPTLEDCTRCHFDRKDKVSCTNALWTAHVSKGYVNQATYQLAETTYLGKLCSGGTAPDPSTSGNLALNRSASASRQESGYEASRAVDGNSTSRWWARSSYSQWLRVDLGSSQSVSRVVVAWYSDYARDYRVEVSTDGSNWTSVASVSSSSGGTRTHTFSSRNARYVRITCTRANSYSGYSIKEIEVYRQ